MDEQTLNTKRLNIKTIKHGPLDKQQQREAGSLCRSGSEIFFNET